MKKLKILFLILGIIISNNAMCTAYPTSGEDPDVTKMQDFMNLAVQAPRPHISTIIRDMESFCLEISDISQAPKIANYFRKFVYNLYSRHITSVERGSLWYFYHNVLIKHFEMELTEIKDIKEAIENIPNVTEYRRSI